MGTLCVIFMSDILDKNTFENVPKNIENSLAILYMHCNVFGNVVIARQIITRKLYSYSCTDEW